MSKSISTPVNRKDAKAKIEGTVLYLGDYQFEGLLYAKIVRSTCARARIVAVEIPELPADYYYFDRHDIPAEGANSVIMINTDWRAFADGMVRFYGEPIGIVVGPDREIISKILTQIKVEYEQLEPALTIADSIACKGGPVYGDDNMFADLYLKKGDPDAAFSRAARIIEDEMQTGYQEHIYMEPQSVAAAWEHDKLTIYASTQCPFWVRKSVAGVLGLPQEEVRVIQTVTGGGFGGKEHYPDVLASMIAVGVVKIKRPVQLVLERDEDIAYTTKRHPSIVNYKTALDENNNIIAMDVDVKTDAGAYEGCSRVVLCRAIFSANSVYNIPHVRIRGRACATNNIPSDAFRGFGAPQGLFAMETHMCHLAQEIGVDPIDLKQTYFLRQNDPTVTNGKIHEEVKLPEMLDRAMEMSGYRRKAKEYLPGSGRGIGISCFKHGSGFTGNGEQAIIKGVVKLKKESDGKVIILVSSVEIGQGVTTGFRKIVAGILEIPLEQVEYDIHDTDRVPDSGPTCASRSITVVGYLLQEAAKDLKEQWQKRKDNDEIEVTRQYSHPPEYKWDQETLQGDAYPSYGWGVVVVEVEVDKNTYEVETKGIWAVFDIGTAIDELIIKGQIDGGIVQALGYASIEKMENKEGRFLQTTMADYVIPTFLDTPEIKSYLVDNPYPYGPFGAKGAGELVFDGVAPAYLDSVQRALDVRLNKIPVTPEYIMEALND